MSRGAPVSARGPETWRGLPRSGGRTAGLQGLVSERLPGHLMSPRLFPDEKTEPRGAHRTPIRVRTVPLTQQEPGSFRSATRHLHSTGFRGLSSLPRGSPNTEKLPERSGTNPGKLEKDTKESFQTGSGSNKILRCVQKRRPESSQQNLRFGL